MCAISTVQDEGTVVSSTATTLNFTGNGVKATAAGATVTVAVPDYYLDAKRDFGASGNGTTDDSTALQNAVNASGTQRVPLVIPAGQYKVVTPLEIPGNVTIFGYGARILSYSPTEGVNGVPIRIVNHTSTPKVNIKIYGLEIDGRRASQPDFQACLVILGNVQNVLIKDGYFHDGTGDGWYTLEDTENAAHVPANLVFEDMICTNNTRQGASICCGRFVTVRGGSYSNTNGTTPGAGIDVEPSVATSPTEYITIEGVTFADNEGPGLLVDWAQPGASPVRYVRVSNCQMISNQEMGISVRNAQDVRVSDCVVGSNGSSGVHLNGRTDAPLRDIVVENTRVTTNASVGVFCVLDSEDGAAKTLKFTDVTSVNNSLTGFQFQGPIDDVQVIGCTSQNRGTSAQDYGLLTGAGVTRFRADLNNLSGNVIDAKVLGDDTATRKYGSLNNET